MQGMLSESRGWLGAHALGIPEIALVVFGFADRPTLSAAARVCRGWAAVALDVLWRNPAPAALAALAAGPRWLGAAAHVRTLGLFTAEQAAPFVRGGWAFPRLRWLALPCRAVADAPDACRAFVARCGHAQSSVLRGVYLTEGGYEARLRDGHYDVSLAGLLTDLTQRRGLEELIIDTVVTERLRLSDVWSGLGHSALRMGDHDVIKNAGKDYDGGANIAHCGQSGERNRSMAISATNATNDVPTAFHHLRRLSLDIATTAEMRAYPAFLPLLCPMLLGAVTHLWLRFDSTIGTTALFQISRLPALYLLRIHLSQWCDLGCGELTALGRLSTLRHLILFGGRRRGKEPFPDEQWVEFASGLRRLRTLEITTHLRLLPHALPILGAYCRELTEIIMPNEAAHAHSWPPSPLPPPEPPHIAAAFTAAPAPAAATAATSVKASPVTDSGGVFFPALRSLCLQSSGLSAISLELWLRSLGIYRLTQRGSVRDLDGPKLAAMQAIGSAFYFARLRKHAPRLAEFRFVRGGALERAVERDFISVGVGAVPVESASRRRSALKWPYWAELYSNESLKTAPEREYEIEL